MTPNADYQTVLRAISAWRPSQRVALARDILGTLALPEPAAGRSYRPSFDRALGLARGDGPPPSDEDVDRWIEGYRMEKYG